MLIVQQLAVKSIMSLSHWRTPCDKTSTDSDGISCHIAVLWVSCHSRWQESQLSLRDHASAAYYYTGHEVNAVSLVWDICLWNTGWGSFDRLHMTSYFYSVVIMALYGTGIIWFQKSATWKCGSEVAQSHRSWYHSMPMVSYYVL